jgi:hypothetical protein
MSAFDERRFQDVQKLRDLAAQLPGRVMIAGVSGAPPSRINIDLRFRTAPSRYYPAATQDVTRVTIDLPSRYPLVQPAAQISTPILHPNVYMSGLICLGIDWLPSLGLDFLVKRIIQIIIFDPGILNEASPANPAALSWYREARRNHPTAFPTDVARLMAAAPEKKISWTDVPNDKTGLACPHCSGSLSLPAGRSGKVTCPRCWKPFEAQT